MSKAMDALDIVISMIVPADIRRMGMAVEAVLALRDYITTTEAAREDVETETIDRLFLELSQFTKAKTWRELRLEARIKELEEALGDMRFAYINKDADCPHQFETDALARSHEALSGARKVGA